MATFQLFVREFFVRHSYTPYIVDCGAKTPLHTLEAPYSSYKSQTPYLVDCGAKTPLHTLEAQDILSHRHTTCAESTLM